MHARVEEHVAIQLREQRRGAHDGRLDFHDVQALQFRIAGERGRRHAAAESDEEHAARRMRERREMAEQKLRRRVVIRGVHFSVGAQGDVIVGSRDGNVGVQAVAEIDDVQRVRVFPQRQRAVVEIPIHHGVERSDRGIVKII